MPTLPYGNLSSEEEVSLVEGRWTLADLRAKRNTLIANLQHAMDMTKWKAEKSFEGGISVESGYPAFTAGGKAYEVEAFHIVSESEPGEGVTLEHFASYFHDACHFASTANIATTKAEIIRVLSYPSSPPDADYEAIVRTGFELPFPLQAREFLHYVTTRKLVNARGQQVVLAAYASFDERGEVSIPPPWKGYLRCKQAPSGQRATTLGQNSVRIEHCMSYKLGGCIPPCIQDSVFHSGHVKAYGEEWQKAMNVLREESKAPASLQVRLGELSGQQAGYVYSELPASVAYPRPLNPCLALWLRPLVSLIVVLRNLIIVFWTVVTNCIGCCCKKRARVTVLRYPGLERGSNLPLHDDKALFGNWDIPVQLYDYTHPLTLSLPDFTLATSGWSCRGNRTSKGIQNLQDAYSSVVVTEKKGNRVTVRIRDLADLMPAIQKLEIPLSRLYTKGIMSWASAFDTTTQRDTVHGAFRFHDKWILPSFKAVRWMKIDDVGEKDAKTQTLFTIPAISTRAVGTEVKWQGEHLFFTINDSDMFYNSIVRVYQYDRDLNLVADTGDILNRTLNIFNSHGFAVTNDYYVYFYLPMEQERAKVFLGYPTMRVSPPSQDHLLSMLLVSRRDPLDQFVLELPIVGFAYHVAYQKDTPTEFVLGMYISNQHPKNELSQFSVCNAHFSTPFGFFMIVTIQKQDLSFKIERIDELADVLQSSQINIGEKIFTCGHDNLRDQLVVSTLDVSSKQVKSVRMPNPGGMLRDLVIVGNSIASYFQMTREPYTDQLWFFDVSASDNPQDWPLEVVDLGASLPWTNHCSCHITSLPWANPRVNRGSDGESQV